MQDALFVDGLPARITATDFRRYHLQSFPKLVDAKYNELIQAAIDDVYTMFNPVQTLWDRQTAQVWYAKTALCFRFLTAWYLTDLYPQVAAGGGTVSMGGIPIKRKKIYGIDITFAENNPSSAKKDYLDTLGFLKSNAWGMKAYGMLHNHSKSTHLFNKPVV